MYVVATSPPIISDPLIQTSDLTDQDDNFVCTKSDGPAPLRDGEREDWAKDGSMTQEDLPTLHEPERLIFVRCLKVVTSGLF